MSDQQPTRPVLPFRLQLERRTTTIKVLGIMLLNLAVFAIAWLVNGQPLPNLAMPPYAAYVDLFPGGLRPLGSLLVTLIGVLLNSQVLRYTLVANLIAMVPFLFGAQFVRRLYGFDSFGLALEYLIEATFDPALYTSDTRDDECSLPADYRQGGGGGRIALIEDGKLVPAGKRPRNRSIAWAGGPGKIVVPPEYAVQLERGGWLTCVVGPGVRRLLRFEKAFKLINLRQIVRKKSHTALTRDGIPVTVEVAVHCRVLPPQPSAENGNSLDEQAIRRLVLNTIVSRSGPVPWEERSISSAGDVLNEVLAKYRLDELFEPLDAESEPRLTIQEEVRRQLSQWARGLGIEITEVWLGEFQLPDEATRQYVAYWQSEWQRRDRARLAGGQASAIRLLGRARAQAQQQVIETLVAAFQAAQSANLGAVASRQLVALRLIDSLEQLYRQAGQDRGPMVILDRHLTQLRRAIRPTPEPLPDTSAGGPSGGGA